MMSFRYRPIVPKPQPYTWLNIAVLFMFGFAIAAIIGAIALVVYTLVYGS